MAFWTLTSYRSIKTFKISIVMLLKLLTILGLHEQVKKTKLNEACLVCVPWLSINASKTFVGKGPLLFFCFTNIWSHNREQSISVQKTDVPVLIAVSVYKLVKFETFLSALNLQMLLKIAVKLIVVLSLIFTASRAGAT